MKEPMVMLDISGNTRTGGPAGRVITMDRISEHVERTIGKEGGYSNHPSDRGGETMWGITEREARAHGYNFPIRDLPRSTAVDIYRSKYYLRPKFDRVAESCPDLAYRLFDTGVLCGPAKPSEWLQRSLNAFNLQQSVYPDITTDGRIGNQTLGALHSYLDHRRAQDGEFVLIEALESFFGHYLFTITGNIEPGLGRVENEDFIYGWFRHRVIA